MDDVCVAGSFEVFTGCTATIVNETLTATGQLLVAGTSFGYSVTATGGLDIDLDAPCAVAGCATVEAVIEASGGFGPNADFTCSADVNDGGCDCIGTGVELESASSGTFTDVATGKISVASGNNTDVWNYCVSGGGMLLREAAESDGADVVRPVYVLSGPQ